MHRYLQNIGSLALTGVLALGISQLPVASAHAATKAFRIDAQDAAKALTEFGRQASTQILFEYELVKGLRTNTLIGKYEPTEAIELLLKGTGLRVTRREGDVLVIEGNRPAKTKGNDAGTNINELSSAGAEQLRFAGALGDLLAETNDTKKSSKSAKAGDGVEEMIVEEGRIKPFGDASRDLPRTANDHQPYYIFNSETIERSGAANIEDFLKQRLTMNAVAQTNGQSAGNTSGNTSTINLRGLGVDKTLILINGRRMVGVNNGGTTDLQPDLNGIPLSAIDRIEVLPSSASGIYGGSAIGGVVNVILKKDYTGGQLRAVYDNTWDTDSSQRTVSGSYGLALEDGKTHLSVNASWSDAGRLLLQDRIGIFAENLGFIQRNSPAFLYSSTNPWLGALPNVTPSSSAVTTLTLKNNNNPLALNSRNTYVPAGTSATTTPANLWTALRDNAGKWNFDFPQSTQSPSGVLRPFGATPEYKSFQTSIRRQMSPKLELFVDASINENRSEAIFSPFSSALTVSANAPTNPFTTDVQVRVPNAGEFPFNTSSQVRSATLGAVAQLPGGWSGAFDYTWSESRFEYLYYSLDSVARNADLLSGALNPFVDTLLYPLNFEKYMSPLSYSGANRLYDASVRGSGQLPSLPWGAPRMTVGLEHRLTQTPERTALGYYPFTVANNTFQKFYEKESSTVSGYLEATVPLVKTASLPLVRALDLQLSGRSERYEVDTGTVSELIFYSATPPTVIYGGTTVNNRPYFSQATYTSKNYTIGLKYQPVDELTLRLSRATAFLPPTPTQLTRNPVRSTSTTPVNDPRTGQNGVPVYIMGGGDPNLKPQNSKSVNAGLIWEPEQLLSGFRLNVEYYRIEQFDAIGTLTAQQIVNQESTFPDRVVRDSSGRITLVDRSSVNLFHRDTAGWDLSVDYAVKTAAGRFSLRAVESITSHLRDQFSQTLPEFDGLNFPSEGGAAKYKANVMLNWEWKQWAAGWTVRYFGSYKQYGAIGGPVSTQTYNGGLYDYYIIPQGSDTIPAQTYHDLFLTYAFDARATGQPSQRSSIASGMLSGLTLQFGMRNVFNKVPPLDTYYANNYYLSPYGDMRLRSYWLSAAKSF